MVKKQQRSKAKLIVLAVIVIVLALLPAVIHNDFYLQFLITTAITAISVVGFDLTAGNMGYTSFGHSAFMGMGAYSMAILSKKVGLNFWVSLVLAIIISALVAYLLAIPSFRLSGLYFSIGTMAFCQIFYLAVYNWQSLTGGTFGIAGVKSPFTSMTAKYYFVYIIFALVVYLMWRLIRSPIGSALTAIKENEPLSESLGIATVRMKRFTFMITGAVAGLAGALSSGMMGFANPASYTMNTTLEYLVMSVVGGSGSLVGPIGAAFVLKIFSQVTSKLQELRMAIYGLLLLIVILFVPGGVYGSIKRAFANRKKAGKKEG